MQEHPPHLRVHLLVIPLGVPATDPGGGQCPGVAPEGLHHRDLIGGSHGAEAAQFQVLDGGHHTQFGRQVKEAQDGPICETLYQTPGVQPQGASIAKRNAQAIRRVELHNLPPQQVPLRAGADAIGQFETSCRPSTQHVGPI